MNKQNNDGHKYNWIINITGFENHQVLLSAAVISSFKSFLFL